MMRKRSVLVIAAILVPLGLGAVMLSRPGLLPGTAVEDETVQPTEQLTETPAELPTETPTQLPTETPTELPTDTPTVTPTSEMWTGEATPTPRPTVTSDGGYLIDPVEVTPTPTSAAAEGVRVVEVDGGRIAQPASPTLWPARLLDVSPTQAPATEQPTIAPTPTSTSAPLPTSAVVEQPRVVEPTSTSTPTPTKESPVSPQPTVIEAAAGQLVNTGAETVRAIVIAAILLGGVALVIWRALR